MKEGIKKKRSMAVVAVCNGKTANVFRRILAKVIPKTRSLKNRLQAEGKPAEWREGYQQRQRSQF